MPNFTSQNLYSKLDPTSRAIRLIRLSPNNTTARLSESHLVECSLEHASLNDPPEYIALSYVWGDPSKNCALNVDGKSVRIPQNLATALRDLRSSGNYIISRPLWIDALCINQDDNEEKAWQVAQMKEIYQQASDTIIWMGPVTKEGNIAMDAIYRLGNNIIGTYGKTPPEAAIASIIDTPAFPFSRVINFFKNPWWTRVWVVQEFVVSKHVWFSWGKKAVPRMYVLIAMVEMAKRITQNNAAETAPAYHRTDYDDPKVNPSLPNFPIIFMMTLQTQNGEKFPSLQELLLDSAECGMKASKPQDRVFALLGLSADRNSTSIRVDYSIRYAHVLIDLAETLLRKGYYMNLSLCRHTKAQQAIPSWVTDWSSLRIHRGRSLFREIKANSPTEIPLFSAGGSSPARLTFYRTDSNSSILQISGWSFDTVSHVRHYPSWLDSLQQFDISELFGVFSEMLKLLETHRHVYSGREGEAVWRTMTLDIEKDRKTRRLCRAGMPYRCEYNYLVQAVHQAPITGDFNLFYLRYLAQELLDSMESRSPFLTRNGFLGLGPMGSLPNDLVVVFVGIETPFLLRPSKNGRYKLLGEAYVHGIMDGEFAKMKRKKDIFEIC